MIAHICKTKGGTYKEQPVTEHLQNTAYIAERMGTAAGMRHLAFLAGILHDLGKMRKRFEAYIRRAFYERDSVQKEKINHSSAGAIYIYRKYYNGSPVQRLTAQIIAVAVLSHHGLNDCMTPDGTDRFHQRVDNAEGLDLEEVMDNLSESSISEQNLDEHFAGAVIEVGHLLESFAACGLSKHFSQALLERMLLSFLIDADRLDTAIFCGNRRKETLAEREVPWKELCNDFEKNLKIKLRKFDSDSEVYKIRKRVEDECLQFAVKISGIYLLSIPTGGAKTIGSMRYALNHAKVYGKRRIFYIAPYLSILEQNAEEFRSLIGHKDMILEHYSNVVFQDDEEEELTEAKRYQQLTENWDAPIVLTTFVKFLEALFDDSTASVRRFHNLADAVILIDEIQTLPVQMIHLFNMAMNYISALCNTTIVLCSATQPVLDKVKNPIHLTEPRYIIGEADSLYHRLKRVRVEEKRGHLDTEELCSFVEEIGENKKSVLVILNTRKAVKQLYKVLHSHYETTEERILLLHLSTDMCAAHRMRNIGKLKSVLGKEKVICIATSLIEAGVDLSFSCVIRSFAGLDSIAQAAGRCNRNGEEEEGVIYLIHYKEEKLGYLEQIRKGAVCSETIVDIYKKHPEQYENDLLSPRALNAFYERYYYDADQRRMMDYPLEEWGSSMVDLLCMNKAGRKAYHSKNDGKENPGLEMFQAFKTAGREFHVIQKHTTGVLVPFERGIVLIKKLNESPKEEEMQSLLREAQQYVVDINPEKLNMDMFYELNCGSVWAVKQEYYDDNSGLTYNPE